jgi:hypothetical protein
VDWHVGIDVLEGLFTAIFKVIQKDWYPYCKRNAVTDVMMLVTASLANESNM